MWIGRNGIVRGEQMEGLQWKIDGRRFCNQEEYMAAKRDKVLIDSIMMNLKLERPKDVEKIYLELKQGKYQFESIVGRQFDDNIYELYTKMKEEEKVKKEQKSSKNQPKKNPTRLKTERTQKSLGKLEDFDSNMKEEILPTIGENEESVAFANSVFDRFRNPFIQHKWRSIALNSVSKFYVRVLPTLLEYKEKNGVYPKGLTLSLAYLLYFYKNDN